MKKIYGLLVIALCLVSMNVFAAYSCTTEWTQHGSSIEHHCQIAITSDASADLTVIFCQHIVSFANTEPECTSYCEASDALQGKLEVVMIKGVAAMSVPEPLAQAVRMLSPGPVNGAGGPTNECKMQ
jgi:hypothetical protein